MKKFEPQRMVTLAVALNYDEKTAPIVSAKGQGDVAQKIFEIAKHHNIPLQENKELVNILSTVELGDHIPEMLYLAVAEIIAFAYFLQGKVPKNTSN